MTKIKDDYIIRFRLKYNDYKDDIVFVLYKTTEFDDGNGSYIVSAVHKKYKICEAVAGFDSDGCFVRYVDINNLYLTYIAKYKYKVIRKTKTFDEMRSHIIANYPNLLFRN